MQKSKISRILNVWLEREVYSAEFIQSLKAATTARSAAYQIPVLEQKLAKSPGGVAAPVNVQTVLYNFRSHLLINI